MSELKFTKIDENGVTEKTLDELNADERLDVELAALVDDVKMLCVVCLAFIPKGSGFYCENHK